MTTHIAESPDALFPIFNEATRLQKASGYLRITLDTERPRTLPQNNFTHAWYTQIAAELPEDDAKGWKCYCKLHHGVPILRAENEDFRLAYDSTIKGMTYEQKLAVMAILPVTSLMGRKQLSKYAEAVQADFLSKGVRLEFPVEKVEGQVCA
jgi:hypothetical protein